jgi:hypothetical protein
VPSQVTETRVPVMRNLSPWQRSHAVWQAAGIDWAHLGPDAGIQSGTDTDAGTDTVRQEPVVGHAGQRRRAPRAGRAVPIALVVLLVAGAGTYALLSGDDKHAPRAPAAVAADRLFPLDAAATSDDQVQELTGIAAAGSTVVAIGSERGGSTRSRFVVSVDGGRKWQVGQVHAADGGEPAPGQVPNRIAGGQGGWLALGGTAVWTSRDGHVWTRRPDAPVSTFGPSDQVNGMVRTAAGFVAVGATGPAGRTQGVIWITADGVTWQRRGADQFQPGTLQPGTFQPGTVVSIDQVAAGGDTVIAHGTVAQSAARTVTKKGKKTKVSRAVQSDAFWRSADGGGTWSAVNVPEPSGALATPVRLVSGPGGFFAVWEVARSVGAKKHKKAVRSAAVVSSPDGTTWSETGQIIQPDYAELDRLGGSGTGLSALMKTTAGTPAVLRSADGRTWQRLGDGVLSADSAKNLAGLAVLPSATVVVGRRGTGDAYLSALGGAGDVDLAKIPGMLHPDRTITALATSGVQIVAVGSGSGDAAVWITHDGRTWQRAQTPRGSGPSRLSAAVHGPQGWVAVGSSGGGPGPAGTTRQSPLVLTSVDGSGWQAATEFPGGGGVVPSAVTYGPAGYVVVGKAGGKAAAWWSADLGTWRRTDLGPGDGRWMSGVAATSAGYVAVGGRQMNADTVQPAVWTSMDGRKWTAVDSVPLPPGTGTGSFSQVLARDAVLVAVGSATAGRRPQAFSAVSADGGRTWQSEPLPGGGEFPAATLTAQGLLVAAVTGMPGRTDVELWTSADGRTWLRSRPHGSGLDGRGAQRLTALTTIGADLLAVGVNGNYLGDTTTLWRTRVP